MWLAVSSVAAMPHAKGLSFCRSSGFCTTRNRHGSLPTELGDRRASSRM